KSANKQPGLYCPFSSCDVWSFPLSGFTVAEIEPMGIFQFALNSRSVSVEENVQAVTLHVQRLFGFQSNLTKLTYQTIPGSAKPLEDFIPIYNGELLFLRFQTNAVIEISIIDDTVSEMEEFFFVNLTSVEVLDVQPVSPDWSPRLNPAFSVATVNILTNDILHGILSLGPEFVYVEEDANNGTPNTAILHIRRTKGFTGDIEVTSGRDLYPFGNVSIKIFDDDEPEGQELFYVFLSDPEGGAQIVEGKDEYGFSSFATVIIAALAHTNVYILLKLKVISRSYNDMKIIPCLQVPEFETHFFVELYAVSTGAALNNSARFAFITVLESDAPRGLVYFSVGSRFAVAHKKTTLISLQVLRDSSTSITTVVTYSMQVTLLLLFLLFNLIFNIKS
uniref:Calx-beta domain-containing protein n=1 Tax=Calidris pygmaea TaxID=425635 RepID=A0A8C3JUL7_9CHAR